MPRAEMRFISRLSIRTKINIGITLLILIFGLVSAVMVVQITSRSLLDEIKKRGASLTVNLAARTTDPLLAHDFLHLKEMVDEVMASSDDILYAFVLDTADQVMSHTFKTGFPMALVQANIPPSEVSPHVELLDVGDDLVYDFAVPIKVGTNRLGVARVGLSRAKAQTTIDSLVRTVFHVSFGTALAAILLGTLFAGTVIRRLNALRQSAEEIVQGNLDLVTTPPLVKQCWEILDCQQHLCPAFGVSQHRCWHMPDTLYHQGQECRGASKSEDCQFCQVYLENRGDEIQSLAEAFDVMAFSLKNYIGDLRRAEQDIRRQQQLLQTILDCAPDLISLQDAKLHYRAVNQAFCRFFGLQEKDILGTGPENPQGQSYFTQDPDEDWQVLSQGRFISKETEVNLGQRKRWFHVMKLPVYDGKRIVGLLFTARDISTIKQYQEKMIHALKMEELGKLAGGLADELNTPLGIILGYTKMLLEDLTQEPETLEYLNVIHKQAQVGHQIVTDLVNFSRQGAGVREKLDVNDSLKEVVHLVRHTYHKEGVAIHTEFDPDIPALLGDAAKLKQVWMHLLNNGFESILQEGMIAVVTKFAADKSAVRISIADNGPGVAPEDLDKIFEPFFNTKSTSLGIGLGLSFAYAVIKDHNGNISVFSPVRPELAPEMARFGHLNGPGVEFLIELPIAPQDAENQETPTLPAPAVVPFS